MLLVNNSPRCRLRSRCPSHLGQSGGIQPALWLAQTRERPRPLCKTEPLSSIPRFWVNTRVLKLNLSLFVVLSIFLSRLSSSFSPSVSGVKEKWKTSTPSRRQLVGKGINLGLKFFGGQNTEETTSERRDWSPSWRAKLKTWLKDTKRLWATLFWEKRDGVTFLCRDHFSNRKDGDVLKADGSAERWKSPSVLKKSENSSERSSSCRTAAGGGSWWSRLLIIVKTEIHYDGGVNEDASRRRGDTNTQPPL